MCARRDRRLVRGGQGWWSVVLVLGCGVRQSVQVRRQSVSAIVLTMRLDVVVLVVIGGWCVVAGGKQSMVLVLGCGVRQSVQVRRQSVGAIVVTVGLEVVVLVVVSGWCVVDGGGGGHWWWWWVVVFGSRCQCAGRVWAQ